MITCSCGRYFKDSLNRGIEEILAEQHGWRKIDGQWKCYECLGLHDGPGEDALEISRDGAIVVKVDTDLYAKLSDSEKIWVLEQMENWIKNQRDSK